MPAQDRPAAFSDERPAHGPRGSFSGGGRPSTPAGAGGFPPRVWLIFAVLGLVLIGYLGVCHYMGSSREVWFANGLDRPYNVEVNGRSQTVPPGGAVAMRLGEGTHTMHVPDPSLEIADETFDIRTSFLARPFDRTVFVVNPDRAAIVTVHSVAYVQDGAQLPDDYEVPEPDARVNQALYRFDGIHYPFQEFPSQLDSMESKYTIRKRLALGLDIAPLFELFYLGEMVGENAAVELAQRRLRHNPDDAVTLTYLQSTLSEEEMLEYLASRLDERPVNVTWHRAYQDSTERARPEFDLEAQYRDFRAAEPENRDLAYLLSRTLVDPAESVKLLRESIGEPDPSAYGHSGMAYHLLASGRFDEAIQHYDRAIELDPDNQYFPVLRQMSLLATGRLDEYLDLVRRQQQQSGSLSYFIELEVMALAAAGRMDQAEAAVARNVASLADSGVSDTAISELRGILERDLAYIRGDVEPYYAAHLERDSGLAAVIARVRAGRADEAVELVLNDGVENTVEALLAGFLAALQTDQHDVAATWLRVALLHLQAEGSRERYLADVLRGERPPDPRTMLDLAYNYEVKPLVLTTLGLRHPEHRDAFFGLAGRLNFEPEPPYQLLKSIYADPPQWLHTPSTADAATTAVAMTHALDDAMTDAATTETATAIDAGSTATDAVTTQTR